MRGEVLMKKYNELQLVEEKGLRDRVIGRTEVLDKVSQLLLLPNTEFATTEQVAKYYNVGISAIRKIATRHVDELEPDGYKVYRKNNVLNFLKGHDVQLENVVGKTIVTLEDNHKVEVPNRGLRLFSKRAILRVGMLLRDSEVAKEIRTRLLDIIRDTEEQSPEIVQGIASEISEEKQLMLNRVEAEMNGDYDLVCEINAKLFALKNKRIKELESLNEKITAHSLTIAESRAVINRIVRTIAMKEYGGMFGKAWNEFYSKINYKLGINIRNRKRDKNDTLLDTLTDEEVFEVEKIARNWAVKVELDLDSLLKIA
jgi:hypothetical protein